MEKIRIVSFRITTNRNEQNSSTGSTENDDPDEHIRGTDRNLPHANCEDDSEYSSEKIVSEENLRRV